VHLTAGETKVCAVDSLSALRCWGENAFYSLADSSVPFRATPAQLPVGRVRHVAAGSRFTCATDAEGHASCWGTDLNGQLGDGGDTVEQRLEPKRVASELAFDTIVAGRIHVCGLAADGAAWCWGGAGLAGDGSREKRLEPARVSGGHLFRSLTAASGVTCGIAKDAAAWCWGLGSDGQLGNGAGIPNDFVPVPVAGGHKFRQLAAGYHRVCGLDVDGLAWCWGSNFNGVLGDTGRVSSPVPVRVRGDRRYETIASGDSHACAIERGGKVWCWGQNRVGDAGGALGDGTIEDRSFPVAVAPKLMGTSTDVPPSSPDKK
jgi:alpha-tubulin suppressor-like RCC1 family protein